jgi:hypothetical protein
MVTGVQTCALPIWNRKTQIFDWERDFAYDFD